MGRLERGDALFLALLALLATALEYRFGLGNQVEQLPLVLHALDPSLLANDFYVRSAAGFGPRFYYVTLLATLAKPLHRGDGPAFRAENRGSGFGHTSTM